VLSVVRRRLADARKSRHFDTATLLPSIRHALRDLARQRLQPVINGTGIIIHTNFGRSPLAAETVENLARVASGYSNLEYDLAAGSRGARAGYLEHNLALLCGAEAATVVNNCAAALVLILRHFAATLPRTQVVVSRGELVQIGGGFRVPEILQASGATLREVGTTNKTDVSDYARALGKQTALVLKVHRSNFFMTGFVESPERTALAALARKHRLPLVEDLGSGAMFPTESFAAGRDSTEHEPTPAESLKDGTDLVCFSGDKLLGGPQAGVIAGRAKHVAALKRDPFFRALRCDKLVLSALEATVDLHLSGRAGGIPTVNMAQIPADTLRSRAEKLAQLLNALNLPLTAAVGQGKSQVGGGSLPRTVIPSATLDLVPGNMPLPALAAALRRGSPPVVGYASGGRLKLDLRTIFPRQDADVVAAVRSAMA